MRRWLIVIGLILLLAVVALGGYIYGIRHTVAIIQSQQAAQRKAMGAEGIPYNSCYVCWAYYPDWYCWLQGCQH